MRIIYGVNYFRVLSNLYKRLELAQWHRNAYEARYYAASIVVVEAYLKKVLSKSPIPQIQSQYSRPKTR